LRGRLRFCRKERGRKKKKGSDEAWVGKVTGRKGGRKRAGCKIPTKKKIKRNYQSTWGEKVQRSGYHIDGKRRIGGIERSIERGGVLM